MIFFHVLTLSSSSVVETNTVQNFRFTVINSHLILLQQCLPVVLVQQLLRVAAAAARQSVIQITEPYDLAANIIKSFRHISVHDQVDQGRQKEFFSLTRAPRWSPATAPPPPARTAGAAA